MGGGASKPNPPVNDDEIEDPDEENQPKPAAERQPASRRDAPPSNRPNRPSAVGSATPNSAAQKPQNSSQRQAPLQSHNEEEEDNEDAYEQEEAKGPTNANNNPRKSTNNPAPTQKQPVGGTRASQVGGGFSSPNANRERYNMNNMTGVQEKNNDMQEDLPKFPQFVKMIKSNIQYPLDMERLAKTFLPENYEFTKNTNVFGVFEEERLALVPRSEALKPYMVLKEVLNNEWNDDDFPCEMQSLTKDPKKEMNLKKIIWKKISEVAPPQGFAIIYDTNKPSLIKPGKLNNKAFQSALSILAEREPFFPSIFAEFNETSNSVLCMWLNHTGEWKIYVLDELFPYDKETSQWAFTYTKNETWVLILEKAFAKMYGTYTALELGHVAHYIHDITGAPYRYFYFNDPEECWQFLTSVDRETTTIVAMSKNPRYMVEDEDDLTKEPSYAFTILDLQELKTGKATERLIKLRDPWVEKSWNGDWSIKSNRWTPQIMERLAPDGVPEDMFWINVNDFVKYYGYGFTFRVFSNYQHSNIRLKHSFERNYSLVLMNVPTATHMFLQANQPDQRHFLMYPEPYSYSLVKMMVVEVDARLQMRRFVTGLYNKGRDCEAECQLQPGDYLVYIEVDWEQNLNREIVFSTYGETNTVLYEVNCSVERLTLVRRFLTQYFKSTAECEELMDYGNFGDKRVRRYIDYVYGYLCFYYQNKSDLYGLCEKVKMDSLYGLEITAPFSDDFEFDVSVKANSETMVIYETNSEGQSGQHYKHRSWSYLYPDAPEEIAKKLVMTKAKKIIKRRMDGREIEVFVHVYAYNGGFCFYYINRSKYIYRERLGLDLFNLVGFDNSEQAYFEITLAPKEDYLLKFKVKDPLQPFSYAAHVSYKINQTLEHEENDEAASEVDQTETQKRQLKGAPPIFPKAVTDMLSKQKKQPQPDRIVQPLKYGGQKQVPVEEPPGREPQKR